MTNNTNTSQKYPTLSMTSRLHSSSGNIGSCQVFIVCQSLFKTVQSFVIFGLGVQYGMRATGANIVTIIVHCRFGLAGSTGMSSMALGITVSVPCSRRNNTVDCQLSVAQLYLPS
ncbi:hypothetical protein RRG08_035926 [Elysia crispata]|uniref:Uncharacterized protein n=1 Tax=Elysia crispata TaxID=231223 RepID=A0AAE1DR40_9GAST|nr:hypothetical protein RRG08_035926 [Elysia crispata]